MVKTKVGLIFGGKSAEHAVSLKSAAAIYNNLDKSKYESILIYINRQGEWCHTYNASFIESSYQKEKFENFSPWTKHRLVPFAADIYFPILHGPNGEDGRIQSLFELWGKPFVGAGSLGSMLAMDKVVSKVLFKNAGLKVADFLFFTENNWTQISELIAKKMRYPLFVKPAALGSSVGISKVHQPQELQKAIDLAFCYDNKILVEQAIDMREIEVAIMGNNELLISKPGELIPFREFYDYEDKYTLGKTQFNIPADFNSQTEKAIQMVAKKAYRCLFLNGMARVDLFYEKASGDIYINEANTIPGFTEISMFPKLFQLEGYSFTAIVSKLIDLGFDHFQNLKFNTYENPGS